MQRKNDVAVDPWCVLPTEEIEVDGIKVTVRGLSIGQVNSLRKLHSDDIELSSAIVAACCQRHDGVAITERSIETYRSDVVRLLNEAVARVNGFVPGNLSATADDTSSSG